MKNALEFYNSIIDCEGDIQGVNLIKLRDMEIRTEEREKVLRQVMYLLDQSNWELSSTDYKRIRDLAKEVGVG